MAVGPDSISVKMRHISAFMISISIIIGGRLIYLQIIKQHLLYLQSQRNFMRFEKVRTQRGNIFDVNGQLIATNRPSTNMYWHGTGKKTLAQEQTELIEQIEHITETQILSNPAKMAALVHAERYGKDFLLIQDLTLMQLSQLQEQFADYPNILLVDSFKRHYPHKKLACHIVGYLGSIQVDALGVMGIEKICEDRLKGKDGTLIKVINSYGTSLSALELNKGLSGQDIYTTIDLEIQQLAETIFPEDQAGVMLLMDPEDGAIKALVSRPSFDPEFFLHRFSQQEWQELQEKRPFLNRACATYPPGSIFKIVTMSAALEHGVVAPDAVWYCPGYFMFANCKVYCHLHTGHGKLTTCESLTHSCNIAFFEIGKRLSIDSIADYAHRFGLGKKTGIILSEKEGIVPNKSWKMKTFHERWAAGETLSVAIGQSFLLVTPIQIACMTGSVFTQNLVKPRILVDEPIEKSSLLIKNDTLTLIKRSMHDVVIHGTARRVGKIRGFDIYAKTSTAQVCALQKEELGSQYMPHAWLTCYFKYKDEPPLVLVLLMEHAGGSRVPVELAHKFFINYRNYKEGDAQPTVCQEQEMNEIPIPLVIANQDTQSIAAEQQAQPQTPESIQETSTIITSSAETINEPYVQQEQNCSTKDSNVTMTTV